MIVVVHRPCVGRLALDCDRGVGCRGHDVRVLILPRPESNLPRDRSRVFRQDYKLKRWS